MGDETRVRALRDALETGILTGVAGSTRNGAGEPRVPNTTNISFERIESESLLIGLDLEGIAVSSGSACSSGTLEPSHVLKAMGLPHARTLSSIRFSLGAGTTEADIEKVIKVLPPLVEKLRSLSTVGGRR
jgi:cysteine desulfurase